MNDCLELMNEFHAAADWRELQTLILTCNEVRTGVETRILSMLSIGATSRLVHARLLWFPVTSATEEFISIGLCVAYHGNPRLAQNYQYRNEFLEVCREEAGISQVVFSSANYRYRLLCSWTGSGWSMEACNAT